MDAGDAIGTNDAPLYDLLVVGGGVNGTGIARDAAGRGLRVLLVEKSDLASATSSASTKLIHGGLRYLEYYAFRLVREALSEREVLLESAPHLIRPLRFVLPHQSALRPAWMIRLGLFLYDRLGGRKRLPASQGLDLRLPPYADALKPGIKTGFAYSDCWVDDARLVALNAVDARERGADIRTRTQCVAARRDGGFWTAEIENEDGTRETIRARGLINATGPWARAFTEHQLADEAPARLRLVKGSHIVVPRLYEGTHAFILQNNDRRIVFAIPYEHDYTLIGTTDIPYNDDPGAVKISEAEIAYLCAASNSYFKRQIAPADIVWSYSGVRPLFDDEGAENASAVSRDYVLELKANAEGRAPLLNVFGGKITTYRRLAEHALQKLHPYFKGARGDWTAGAFLPGGDIADADFARFNRMMAERYPWMPDSMLTRYCRAYGTRLDQIVGSAATLAALGQHFGGDLYENEVAYLAANEWAKSAQDILWRRSKLGLHLPTDAAARLDAWFQRHAKAGAAMLKLSEI